MLTARDIEEYPLEKSLGGYKTESVDAFLDKVAADYQKLSDDNAALSKKITVLVESINKYRQDEDYIKTTLIESQKLAASTVAKANEEAEGIVASANEKADEVIVNANTQAEATIAEANAKSDAIIKEAEEKVAVLQEYFNNLQEQVDAFRSHLLATYKAHIEAISDLPVYEKPAVEETPEAEECEFEEISPDDERLTRLNDIIDDEEAYLEEIEEEEALDAEEVEE